MRNLGKILAEFDFARREKTIFLKTFQKQGLNSLMKSKHSWIRSDVLYHNWDILHALINEKLYRFLLVERLTSLSRLRRTFQENSYNSKPLECGSSDCLFFQMITLMLNNELG